MDSVPARTAPHDYDEIACLQTLERFAPGDQTGVATVHKGVAGVSLVEVDRAVRGRDAHPVAVVPDPCDHALEDPAGMEASLRHLVPRQIGRAEAEHVCVEDRLRTESCAERISDDAAYAGARAAVGLDGRGVVVGLDLETDVVPVVELDDPRVVLKYGHTPGSVQLLRDPEDGASQQVLDDLPIELDAAPERLVHTVFRPRLRERLQLRVRRVPAEPGEVFPDRMHLYKTQRKLPLPADAFERRVVRSEQIHLHRRELIMDTGWRAILGPNDDVLDHLVREQRVAEPADILLGCWAVDHVLPGRPYGAHVRDAQIP